MLGGLWGPNQAPKAHTFPYRGHTPHEPPQGVILWSRLPRRVWGAPSQRAVVMSARKAGGVPRDRERLYGVGDGSRLGRFAKLVIEGGLGVATPNRGKRARTAERPGCWVATELRESSPPSKAAEHQLG